ncbi:MAG: type I asparaginase [Bacteroidetes bacterium]|nr:type I asparaginase [Bacteroidota bacterium]
MKQSVLLLYTGGTIGMKTNDLTGGLAPFNFKQIEEEVPELKKFNINIDTYTFDPLIDSSNVKPSLWLEIANIIKQNYNKYDGFVVLHGTDTMAYSASALSFMLPNLTKPIIFTGSQIPIGVLRTDGKENLISSIEIASQKKNGVAVVPEVCIYFQNHLLRANRTTKFSAEHFNAFKSENYHPLAKAGIKIEYSTNNILPMPENTNEELQVISSMCEDVVVIDIFPGISQSILSSILNIPNVKGFIMRTFGSGNAPTDSWFIEELEKALKRGVAILNVTQCPSGSVNMELYDTGKAMSKIGIISGHDITTEAAITKMMFLLGQHLTNKQLHDKLSQSLRGEITI